MTIKRLTLAFKASEDIAVRHQHYAHLAVGDGRELSVTARSEGKARTELEREVRMHISKSLGTEMHGRYRFTIGCADGHVLTMHWCHDTQQIYVAVNGPDRAHSSSTHGGKELERPETAREWMRHYARDCFGGIAWENR